MNIISERIRRLVKRFPIGIKSKNIHALDKKLVMSLKTSRIPNWAQIKRVSALLSSREKRIIGGVVLVLLFSIAGWGYSFYKNSVIWVPAEGGIWSEALIGQPTFINPILSQTSDINLDLSRLIFRGLLRYDTDLAITTDLANDFSIDETQTKYTFVLRDDVFWQDGTLVTVDDVIFTIRAIQDPEWQSPLLVSFKGITIDKVDENTIIFNLPEPFGPFLSILTVGILPKEVWQDIPSASARLAEFNIKPFGNGPWKFNELSKEKSGTVRSYSLIPNEFYSEKKPYLSELVFRFYPDFTVALEALNQNKVMGISFLPSNLRDNVFDSQKFSFNVLSLPQYTALFFNQKENELLKSRSVRTALARAINKPALIKEGLDGQAIHITSPVLSLETEEAVDLLDYNPELSRELLSEDGWVAEENAFRTKDGVTLSVTLTTVDRPENAIVANLLRESWEAIGVQTTVRLIASTEIQTDSIKNRDYGILLYGALVGADPDPFPFWHSSQADHPGLNLSLFRDSNTDILLETARQERDASKRNDSYTQFRDILQEEIPAVFLYSPTYTYVQEKRLQGFNIQQLITPADRFNNSTEWYTKTKRKLK